MRMSDEKRLLRLFRALDEEQRRTVLSFAEFLAARRQSVSAAPLAESEPIPRPEQESVAKAIKRLTATYPMLERSKLLHETSACMARHIMHGKPAAEVIDELELVFLQHYERYRDSNKA